MTSRILVIDNYDSFTYNLVQYLGELGAEPLAYRNDAITHDEAVALAPDGIVLSPGPGHPGNERDFGVCADLLKGLAREVPTLGVCLGLQGFAHHYGGRVVHAPKVRHGKTSPARHDGEGVFRGLPNPVTVGRYHSLVVAEDGLPDDLVVTARTPDGEIMGLRHRTLPIEGVQFHPESILTDHGLTMMRNFLDRTRPQEATT